MKTRHIQHLYWRAGFGINPSELQKLKNQSKSQIVGRLFEQSSTFTPLTIDTSNIDEYIGSQELYKKKQFPDFIKMCKKKLPEHNGAWIQRLADSDEMLRERMTLFWANHFVCQDYQIYHILQYNNCLREHALGNFGDFVKAISDEASMIKYLNNKQNVKSKPNENFGRELMELFTLGEGNYSEKDIKEAARAFTGWSFKFNGEFYLKKPKHDFDEKEFFDKRGNFDGNDIIDIILEQEKCAKYVCTKIYRYFVNDVVDEKNVAKMTKVLFKDYNIENLMKYIFMSDWFYDEKNIGTKIKSPVELLVGIKKTVPVTVDSPRGLFYLQNIMGQVLLRPPNVAGWKGGKNWIDSNTIMVRLRVPSVLLNNAIIDLDEKGELDATYEMYYKKKNKRKGGLKATPDWSFFNEYYGNVPINELSDNLIQGKLNKSTAKLLSNLEVENKRDYCIQLMSIPEYQMC
ncbi:MAG: DUF1800 domain-containing protein [Urechidicola sp.]|nr:DUF1800 domain-containing protein [Urechidicola sp.]